METCYVYPNGSPYRDAEVLSLLRSCAHDSIINSAPRIGEFLTTWNCIDRVHIEERRTQLEKCNCVSYVVTIAPVLNNMRV